MPKLYLLPYDFENNHVTLLLFDFGSKVKEPNYDNKEYNLGIPSGTSNTAIDINLIN